MIQILLSCELFYSFIFAFDIYQTNKAQLCSFRLIIAFLSFDNNQTDVCSVYTIF